METHVMPVKEKRRNNEKRKEKSRDAARCRRSKESEIFSDLANVLPLPTSVVTHLDKASIMRLVIAHLRIMNMLKAMGINKDQIKKGDLFDQYYLQSIGGIVLVISVDGDIIYVSNNVSTYLDVSQVDLLGQSFFDMIHPCDHQDIRDLLSGKTKNSGKMSIFVRVKCSQSSRGRTMNLKATSYKVLHIVGRFLKIDESPKERFGFVTIATPIPHPVDIETPLGSYTFLSKHTLDMKFTYADERMTEFLGYNPDDLIGESLYNFHHVEDNREIMKSFKSLFEKGQSETCQYRFMAQGGGYIWVCTQATVLYCDKKNTPLSVVCVNYVVSGKYDEVDICSREQIEWVKNTTKPEIPAIIVTEPVITKQEKEKSRNNLRTKANIPTAVTQQNKNKPIICTTVTKSTPIYLSVKVQSEKVSPGQSPRPRPATSEIFGPRTADMDKGFLTFSDDDSDLPTLKEEPEDLTHLAPTAGDVCVPLTISPSLNKVFINDFLTDEYSPLINRDRDTPLFSTYSNGNTSRSLSPVLTQSPSGYSVPSLCGLSDDTPSLQDATVTSFLGLDLVDGEHEPDKPDYIDITSTEELPLLSSNDFLWDDVSSPASPSFQSYNLSGETKFDTLNDFSNLANLLQLDEGDLLKKCPEQNGGIRYDSPQPTIPLDQEKRKRTSVPQEEIVKKRKHECDNGTSSVLLNLLTEGRDLTTGYTCFDPKIVTNCTTIRTPSLSNVEQ